MKAIELTQNEKDVLVAIVENAKEVGDTGVEFILQDVAKVMNKNIRSISATAGSLAKKGMLLTANGESYFDGRVTDAGLHVAQEVNKVKQEVTNKTNTHMEENNVTFESPAVDERIVKLNELKAVKMASLSKSKRPAAKANKVAAQYILENWDNMEMLQKYTNDPTSPEESTMAWEIADSRVKELMIQAAKAENERKEKEEAERKAKEAEQAKKEAASKAKATKEDKTTNGDKKAAKTARKIGDLHPNGKWVWTEYQPGKFDWRTIPSLKQQGKRTDTENKEPKKQAGKPASKAKKSEAKKTEQPKKAKKPTYTIDEWVALPTKSSSSKNKMSEAQKEAFKLINKGYRITADKKFYKNAEGTTKACNWASVEAMLKRYGIDYVPMGLVMEE